MNRQGWLIPGGTWFAEWVDVHLGLQILSTEQLEYRLAELTTALHDSGAGHHTADVTDAETDLLVEYVTLQAEAEARHRDQLATIAYRPPQWVVGTLGERPADPVHRDQWDAVVGTALRYRTKHRIPEEAQGLLGSDPFASDVE